MFMAQNKRRRKPLRQRIREAGGLYLWFNSTLIRLVDGQLHCPEG
jgi:hypothetical protein